jgi:hypothetical protein
MSELKDKKAADIFDYSNLEKSYKALLKKYHPDIGGSNEDFMYLQEMYAVAKKELSSGVIVSSSFISFPAQNILYTFETYYDFGYGKVFWDKTNLIYQFKQGQIGSVFTDFRRHGVSQENFEGKILPSLPKKSDVTEFEAGGSRFVVMKSYGDYLLQYVINRADIPIETAIWIFNRLYALGCYMQAAKIYNLDISPYTVLLNLERHCVSLFGGWWYTATSKSPLKMPVRTFKLLPRKVKEKKHCTIEVIGELIHATMNDIFHGREIPAPFEKWLRLPACSNILDEYEVWEHTVMGKICPVRAFYKWTL